MNREGLAIVTQVMVMAIVISVILLFLGIVALVLIHICIVGRALRRRSDNAAAERGRDSGRSTSMSVDDVEKLRRFDFQERQKGSSPVVCAVCLDNFEVGDNCRQLPLCKHNFHTQCVDLWLLKAPICPICRSSAHYLWKGGDVSGGESSHFSESGRDFSESQTTTATAESGRFSEREEVQLAEIGHLSIDVGGDEPSETQAASSSFGVNQTVSSSRQLSTDGGDDEPSEIHVASSFGVNQTASSSRQLSIDVGGDDPRETHADAASSFDVNQTVSSSRQLSTYVGVDEPSET